MKISSPSSAVYFFGACFLFFSTFSFALPMLEDSGEEKKREKQKEELQAEQRERARMATEDSDADITESSSQAQRGIALPPIAEAVPANDSTSQLAAKYDLAAAYSSSGRSRVSLPSISAMRKKINSLSSMDEKSMSNWTLSWPMKEMTRVKVDQEYDEALKFLELNDKERAISCSQGALRLTAFYQLLWNDSLTVATLRPRSLEIYQKLISLSLLARSAEEMSDLSNGEEEKGSEHELQKNEEELVQRRDQVAEAWRLALQEFCDGGGDIGKLDAAFVSLSTDLDLLGVEWIARKKNLAAASQEMREKKIQAVRDFITSNFGPNFGKSGGGVLRDDKTVGPHVLVRNVISNSNERRSIFDSPRHLTAILGSMTVLVAALAYEWHLHFLRSSKQASSS